MSILYVNSTDKVAQESINRATVIVTDGIVTKNRFGSTGKPARGYFTSQYDHIKEGGPAFVAADSKMDYTYQTTEVLSHNIDTGVFETKNSVYLPQGVVQ